MVEPFIKIERMKSSDTKELDQFIPLLVDLHKEPIEVPP